MSALASSVVTALFVDSCYPVSGCSNGSTETLWHTSVIRLAVMSLISLWRIIGNPPGGQLRACLTLSGFPHRQYEGSFFSSQPYLRHTVSRKALLCKVKPWSCIGRAVNQEEALLQRKVQGTLDGKGMVVEIEYRHLAQFVSS